MTAQNAKGETAKPTSLSTHKRNITLARARRLCERLIEYQRDGFETYVRAHREYYGYDPDTEEVGNVWPEDVVDDD